MIKFRLMFDKDKEVAWLNQMAKEGHAMQRFFAGVYTFADCEPGKYEYQIDMVDSFGGVSDNYREFMKEAGIEIVQTWGFWVILRKEASDEAFVLYTDVDSQIEHYTKIKKMFKIASVIELLCLIIETWAASKANEIYLWLFVGLLTVLSFVLIRATMNTCNMLEELKERKTGIPSERLNRKNSPILTAGLLMNCVGLLGKESLPSYIVLPIQILAIVLMLIGICDVLRLRNK